jgi:4-O-beta-D-mannosyl-D-glucose phosphorylase
MLDYVINTPEDPLRSRACVEQRIDLIKKNLDFMKNKPEYFKEIL